MRSFPTIIVVLLLSHTAFSQYTNREEYDIKAPTREQMASLCGRTKQKIRQLPPEVRFSARVIGDTAFLYFNDVKLFWQFFESKKDGFALDITNMDQYRCDNIHRFPNSYTHKGFLLPPVYRDQIQKTMHVTPDGWVRVPGGVVPRNFDRKKLEVNYLIIANQMQCDYTWNVNIESMGWDLLSMGLYYDTLYRETMGGRYRDLEKTLRFTIPFKKNTAVYSKADIKPMYDSLKLTDFEISAIRITSYTSVEGSLERNIELQNERAQSIIAALQSFQPESIKSEVTSSENWVEFLEAISGTSYQNMMTMTKEEVKEALKDPKLAEKLEPVLAGERKAVIELQLEKRVPYNKASPGELKSYFQKSITEKNINEALYLQEIIFHKIRREELPYNFLAQLEIPNSIEYGSLLLNANSFMYDFDNKNLAEALSAFQKLNVLLGGDSKVEYNICALEIRAWRQNVQALEPRGDLKTDIESLIKKGVPEILVLRLMVNFSLVQTEIDLLQGKYKEREKWLQFVLDTYKKIEMPDADLVSLARFLSHNSRFDWAEKILLPRTTHIDVSENLIFQYLTLTIYSEANTSSQNYRTFMLNAVNINRKRFCHIFDPISQGGVTFQLLQDETLKKTWCENCNLKP